MNFHWVKAGLALCLLGLVAACGEQQATHFITSNEAPPHTARQKDGDVPRDRNGRPFQYPLLGLSVPDFTVVTPEGETVTQDAQKGQWTILYIWGLWCPDCIVDGPLVAELGKALADDPDLAFMTIHSPPSEKRRDEAFGRFGSIENYFRAKGYTYPYPYLIDADASAKSGFRLPWVPSYLVVDPDGIVRGYRSDLTLAGKTPVQSFISDAKQVIANSQQP